jgi:hypothetical protein
VVDYQDWTSRMFSKENLCQDLDKSFYSNGLGHKAEKKEVKKILIVQIK